MNRFGEKTRATALFAVMAIFGAVETEAEGEHFVRSQDGRTALWVGVADDLWKIGKPFGKGGPWLGTAVKSGEPSDPYIVTGFDRKRATVTADRDVAITLEFDATGTATWIPLVTFDVQAGETLSRDISGISAYWVRAVADKDCRADVQFVYE